MSGVDGRRVVGYVKEFEEGDGVGIHYACELVVRPMLMQDPKTGQTQQVGVRCFASIDGCLEPPYIEIRGPYTILNLDNLDKSDKREFERMLHEAEEGMTEARAKRAGIVTAAPGGAPNGPIIHS